MEDPHQLVHQATADGVVIYHPQYLIYKCKLCNKPMTGEVPLAQHLKSKQHEEAGVIYAIKHLRDAPVSLMSLLPAEVRTAVEEQVIVTVELPEGGWGIRCTACDTKLSGLTPTIQHLSGGNHKKRLRTSALITSIDQHSPNLVPNRNRVESSVPSWTGSMVEPTGNQVNIAWGNSNGAASVTGNNNFSQMTNETSTAPAIEATGYNFVNQSWREPLRLPCPGNLPSNDTDNSRFLQPSQLFSTPTLNNMATSSDEMEIRPMIDPRTNYSTTLDSSANNYSLVQQAVSDQVLMYDKETMRYRCCLCALPLTENQQQIEAHLKHKTHKEEGAKYVVSHAGVGPQSLLDLLPKGAIEAAMAGTVVVTESNKFQCLTCDVFSTGVTPLKQHLEGSEHFKKTMTTRMTTVCPPQPQFIKREDNLQCIATPPLPIRLPESQPCGAASAEISEDSIDLLAEAFEKEVAVKDPKSGDLMKCTICDIYLNGHKNLEQHLKGNKHLKQFQRRSLKKPSPLPAPTTTQTSESPNIPIQNTSQPKWTYQVKSVPRGHVHIFNYMFTGRDKNPKERKGAQMDTQNIMMTFNTMGYEVFPHVNLTSDETENKLEEIRQNEELAKVDVLVMFFMSHGNHPFRFYANDIKVIDLRNIWYKFTNKSCPSMKKKPKIIFSNFCRGENDEEPEEDAIIDIPKDIATIHAVTAGITALRNRNKGTLFVMSLCDILENHARDYDLREIYYELDTVCKSINGRQPKWEDDRFYKFYFNPI